MCLDTRKSLKERKSWLKNKPTEITAYKVVIKSRYISHSCPYYSAFHGSCYYDEANEIPAGGRKEINAYSYKEHRAISYVPYYHLYLTRFAADQTMKKWNLGKQSNKHVIVKCKIPKKDITEIGTQQVIDNSLDNFIISYYTTIVTKSFKIIEEVK